MAKRSPDELNSDTYYCCDVNRFHDNSICPYLHVRKESDLKKVEVRKVICSFYLAKKCKYNSNCIFAHVDSSESRKDCNNAEEVVQEEPHTNPDNLDETLPEIEQSENIDSQHAKPGLELSDELILGEQVKHKLRLDDYQVNNKASSTNNNASCPTTKFLEDSDENVEIAGDFSKETSLENLNVDSPPIHYLESVQENHSKELPRNNNQVNSDLYQKLITANESSDSQSSLLDVAAGQTLSEEHAPSVSGVKECGICQEKVGPGQVLEIFGTLVSCDHCFCLNCIKQWREQANSDTTPTTHQDEQLNDSDSSESWEDDEPLISSVDPKIARSCPVCRTPSDFVVPCDRWVESGPEKDKLVASFIAKKAKINCKYFVKDGVCKFGKHCFFLHSAYYCKQFKLMYRRSLLVLNP